jgi:hypothetical protein
MTSADTYQSTAGHCPSPREAWSRLLARHPAYRCSDWTMPFRDGSHPQAQARLTASLARNLHRWRCAHWLLCSLAAQGPWPWAYPHSQPLQAAGLGMARRRGIFQSLPASPSPMTRLVLVKVTALLLLLHHSACRGLPPEPLPSGQRLTGRRQSPALPNLRSRRQIPEQIG